MHQNYEKLKSKYHTKFLEIINFKKFIQIYLFFNYDCDVSYSHAIVHIFG